MAKEAVKKQLNTVIYTAVTAIILIACAATACAVGASPLRMEYSGKPGEVIKSQVVAYNNTDSTQNITAVKSDFKIDEETGDVRFYNGKAEDLTNSLYDWVKVPEDNFIVEPHEKVVIPYEIHIPEGAEPQGYYTTLFVQSAPYKKTEQQQEGAKLALQVRVAHYIMLDVEGEGLVSEVSLSELFAGKNEDRQTADIEFVFANAGNIHSAPNGKVELINEKGETIDEIEINAGGSHVMPGAKLSLFASYPLDKLPPGQYLMTFRGETDRNEHLEAEANIEVTEDSEIIIHEYNLKKINGLSLRAAAHQKSAAYSSTAAIITIVALAVVLALLAKFYIVKNKAIQRLTGKKKSRKKRKK
jgi:hypothetical protein